MLPRRGYSGGYGDGYNNYNPWNREVSLGIFQRTERHLWIVATVFDCLLLTALLIFLLWAFSIRQPRRGPRNLPIGAIIGSLLAFIASGIARVVYDVFVLSNATVKEYFAVDFFLQLFLLLLGLCIVFYIFYKLTHQFLEKLTHVGNPYAVVNAIHWIFLGILVLIATAEFVLWVIDVCDGVEYGPIERLNYVYDRLSNARTIVFWIAALEVVAWSIFVAIKAGSHRFRSRAPAGFLILGTVFYFGLNFMSAIVSILYNLERIVGPEYLYTAEAVITFSCLVGSYVGVLMCCKRWSQLNLGGDDDEAGKQAPAAPAYHP